MKIEAKGFSYEKYGFRRAKISVDLNPDGSVTQEVDALLKKSFRRNQDASVHVVLYTTGKGSIEQAVPRSHETNASEILHYATTNSLYTHMNIPMARATISRMHLREDVFGDATDNDIVKIYRSIPGPRPLVKSLVPLWEKARFEEMVKDERDIPDKTPDPLNALQKLTDQANRRKT